MIYLIAGRPRSGKTFEAVKYHIVPAIKAGRKVITNIPLDLAYISKIHGPDSSALVQVVDFDFAAYDKHTSQSYFSCPEHYQDPWRNDEGQGPLYVVDEAHFPIPKGRTSDALKNFFTMHGHYGIDIILLSQQPRQIDLAVLGLVEIVYRTIKNTSLGSSKSYTKKVQDGWRGEVVNTEIRRYDKITFPYYKSHTQSKKAVLEAEAGDIKPLWKHWSFKGAALMFVLFIVIIMSIDVNPIEDRTEQLQTKKPVPTLDNQPRPNFKPRQAEQSQVVSTEQPTPDPRQPAKQQKPKEQPYPFPSHPFYKVDLHIAGISEYGEFGNPTKFVDFSASRNGQLMFDVSSRDLILAGYDLVVINPCLVYIQFREYKDYITCDAPVLEVSSSADKLAQRE